VGIDSIRKLTTPGSVATVREQDVRRRIASRKKREEREVEEVKDAKEVRQ
jgi:hypothetical protein